MIRFSDMEKQNILEDADYLPFIDSDEPDVEQQNKTVTWKYVKDFLMRDVNANEKIRQQAENERIEAEKSRKNAEVAREDKETGYVAQAKKWATYSSDTNEMGSDSNNSHFWSDTSKRWAVGDTGSVADIPSDSNNAFFYSKIAKQYSNFNAPNFYINFDTMELMMEKQSDGSELNFWLDDNKRLWFSLVKE